MRAHNQLSRLRLAARQFSSCGPRLSAKKSAPAAKSQHLGYPLYNIKHLYANPDEYIASCTKRRLPAVAETIPIITSLHQEANECRYRRSEVYHERKVLQQQIKQPSVENRQQILARLSELKQIGGEVDDKIAELEEKIRNYMDYVPNLLPDDAPVDEEEVVKYLNPSDPSLVPEAIISDDEFRRPIDYEEKRPDHVDIGVELGIIDLTTASKVSGHAFYYLVGDGALLEQALIQYALSKAAQAGFKLMAPPSVVRREYALACGFRPRAADGERQIYNLTVAGGTAAEEENAAGRLCLTGTAEIPLAAWASDRAFKPDELPLKVAGVSRSYRAEAGAHGRDTRGIYRVHEFTKVELFAWVSGVNESLEPCEKESPASTAMLEELRKLQEEILSDLGLHCRVLNMPTTDLGASAYKKYDIEAWMPGRQGWGEVTSASNCTDYQARRLHTRLRTEASLAPVHTLNGTAMAVPRVIAAILETFYDPGRKAVWIPVPLRRFMGKSWITQN
ncbi:hypothetical protein BZA70DRAFT_276950 [Myxozyma melibiosi]|uniref:serine--tRNA ligase n=1 Tax=Myxozyma melibiosi TaxID=54550 RepID=A0ABR1F7C3_9ASCO